LSVCNLFKVIGVQNNGDGIDPVEFKFRRPEFANIVVLCVCASGQPGVVDGLAVSRFLYKVGQVYRLGSSTVIFSLGWAAERMQSENLEDSSNER
jgi:hypothetical protein